MNQKTALVCGAGGFIGYHLVKRYKDEGFWVRGVDIKYPQFGQSHADEFLIADLRNPDRAKQALSFKGQPRKAFDDVCQLAANMGGVGFISGNHNAEIMHDSALINLNVLEECLQTKAKRVLYTSSACIYPERNQLDPSNPQCAEDSAYPAEPDTEYGWEKLFSERLYLAYEKDYGMNIRIVRLHNVFGPQGTWRGGREKAPAAICRKVAEAKDGGNIQIWGKGDQTRSFIYIDECIEGLWRIMRSENKLPPLNLGSTEMVSIEKLALAIADIAKKRLNIRKVNGPEGVRGRNSDNRLIFSHLQWQPNQSLEEGLKKLYPWIKEQVLSCRKNQ